MTAKIVNSMLEIKRENVTCESQLGTKPAARKNFPHLRNAACSAVFQSETQFALG
jgi:hypothetical protein